MVRRPEHHRVVIVGTGFAGLGAAIRLKQTGEDDLIVLERASDVGGCWRDNTYPGLQCDVQSVVYSFSFAPNPDWSRAFPWGSEIHAYLKRVAAQHDLYPLIRFDTEVQEARWDADRQLWHVPTSRASTPSRARCSTRPGGGTTCRSPASAWR
jgi:cation diffusion facilitator CzcD-associated flavoprotein CzcO